MRRLRPPVLLGRRIAQLIPGLIFFGVGIGFMVKVSVGVPPWDVLATGLVESTGINFGTVVVLIGIGVLLLWIPLREKPGIGTILNALMLGPIAEVIIWILPDNDSLYVRIPLFIFGMCLVALGSGLYIGAQFGAGPRDGLMTGLHRVTGLPIWCVRTVLEVSALAVGWLLGGNVGLGTLAFALGIGPLADPALRWFDLRQRILDAIKIRDAGTHPDDSSSTIERC